MPKSRACSSCFQNHETQIEIGILILTQVDKILEFKYQQSHRLTIPERLKKSKYRFGKDKKRSWDVMSTRPFCVIQVFQGYYW
jgi:hypothetical protein